MKEFESPTYILDLDHSLNRATIEGAEPNKKIKVLVRPEKDTVSKPIAATGELIENGKIFHVVVVTDRGEQSFDWMWGLLQSEIDARRK